MVSILEAKKLLQGVLIQRPDVVGVGVNYDTDAIRVYVNTDDVTELLPPIPSSMSGFPIEIIQIPNIKTLSSFGYRGDKFRPVVGGVSAAHPNVTAGTIGAIIIDGNTGNKLLLSNNHVFANSDSIDDPGATKGDPIYQPGCFSEDTRVLTRGGFKYFYELCYDDEICTLNPESRKIEYYTPTKIHKYMYNGDMVLFSGQMYDQLVTPNHNLVVIPEYRNEIEFITPRELIRGIRNVGSKHRGRKSSISHGSLQFVKNGIWDGVDVDTFNIPPVCTVSGKSKGIVTFDMDVWLSFFGWYLSEGSLGGSYNESVGNYRISIRQMNRKSLDEIAGIISDMGFSPYVRYNHGSIEFHSKELHAYLRQFGYADSKFIPPELKELSPRYLRILMKSLFRGDGSFVKSRCDQWNDNNIGEFRRYYTVSRQLSEDVAEIALKCGYGISIRKRENFSNKFTSSRGGTPVGTRYKDAYVVGVSCRNLTPRITKKPEVVVYNGFVYDVTVKNHILMVERNGKSMWSGNSYDGGVPADTVATLLKWIPFSAQDDVNIVDAAIAMPTDQSLVSPYILADIGGDLIQIKGVRSVSSKIPVKKYSRTTDVRRGMIVDWDFTVSVEYEDGRDHTFVDQILVGIETGGGDSGSILLDEDDYAVGLIFAGGTDASGRYFGVANKIRNVLAMLGGDINIMNGLSPSYITEPKPTITMEDVSARSMAAEETPNIGGIPVIDIAIAGIGIVGAAALWKHLNNRK